MWISLYMMIMLNLVFIKRISDTFLEMFNRKNMILAKINPWRIIEYELNKTCSDINGISVKFNSCIAILLVQSLIVFIIIIFAIFYKELLSDRMTKINSILMLFNSVYVLYIYKKINCIIRKLSNKNEKESKNIEIKKEILIVIEFLIFLAIICFAPIKSILAAVVIGETIILNNRIVQNIENRKKAAD